MRRQQQSNSTAAKVAIGSGGMQVLHLSCAGGRDITAHEDMCGARTEVCVTCGVRVLAQDAAKHAGEHEAEAQAMHAAEEE